MPGVVTGSKTRPARRVGDVILSGDDLKQSARSMVERRLRAGAEREGLGAWVARQYTPPMSDRWGQERVAEVPDPAAGTPGIRSPQRAVDARGLRLIDPFGLPYDQDDGPMFIDVGPPLESVTV